MAVLLLGAGVVWADDSANPPTTQSPAMMSQSRSVEAQLNQAGIYDNGGKLLLDRNVETKYVKVGTATVSSMTITGVITVPNGVNSTDAAAYGQIQWFQLLSTTTATAATTTSSTFTSYPKLTVTITPSSTSHRIRITCTTVTQTFAGAVSWTLKRGSTELSGVANGLGFANISDGAAGSELPIALSYIDSPSTTSPATYGFYFRSNNNSTSVQVGRTDLLSVMTVEEIL